MSGVKKKQTKGEITVEEATWFRQVAGATVPAEREIEQ